MRSIKQVNIENCQNYFFNDMTNTSDFYRNLLNADSIEFKRSNFIIYDINILKI